MFNSLQPAKHANLGQTTFKTPETVVHPYVTHIQTYTYYTLCAFIITVVTKTQYMPKRKVIYYKLLLWKGPPFKVVIVFSLLNYLY